MSVQESDKIQKQLSASALLDGAKDVLNTVLQKYEIAGVNVALLKQAVQAYAEAYAYFNCQVAYFNWAEAVDKDAEGARNRIKFIKEQINQTTKE